MQPSTLALAATRPLPLAGCWSGDARTLHLPPASRCCCAPPPNPGRQVQRRNACARCRTSAPRTRTGMRTRCWPTSRHPPFQPPAPAPPAAAAAVRQSACWFLGAPQVLLPLATCLQSLEYSCGCTQGPRSHTPSRCTDTSNGEAVNACRTADQPRSRGTSAALHPCPGPTV